MTLNIGHKNLYLDLGFIIFDIVSKLFNIGVYNLRCRL